ncbi:MAG TPA: LLM class flavin-dependent oxidoreductase [Caulobacteraceae bacterium]|nr:LLM class flavin-dependent oxidoreductase [Caulobacteraceae bacterium]
MSRIKFGAFLAPHHPIGEHPTLQLRKDLDFAEQLDKLGYDEFWVGEHHSTGWEVIASPELFLAAAAERTHNIRLGSGVISLPYHHPFNVAQRIVQLDHMSRGRFIFGSGPGALPSDAYMLGIDPMLQRDRQDEAIGVIKRLLSGERVTHESDWFTLRDARLQLFPLQEDMPFAVASQVSPSGMTLAGKYGAGVLSIGSMSTAGLLALPTQWGFAEESAAKHGQTVDRKNWRVVMTWHIAETREQARKEAGEGLMRWHNEYNVGTLMRPGAVAYGSPDEAVDQTALVDGAASVIGTPDDLVKSIRDLQKISGGFGTVIGFAHDWANREATARSWDLVARYVIPEVNGLLEGYRTSRQYVIEHRESFERAGAAVMSKIMANEKAAAALQETMRARTATTGGHTPDLEAEKAKQEAK